MAKRKKLTLADFPNLHANHRGRMRSRILRHGASSLEPHELLETLLYLPIARQNTNHTAHMLVEKFGSIEQVLHRPPEELTQIQGVGDRSATFLRDMGRVIDAHAQSKRRGRTVLTNSAEARRLAGAFFEENPDAQCALFSLDEAMRLLAKVALPPNPTTGELFHAASRFRASRAIIALRDGGSEEKPSHGETKTFEVLSTAFSLLKVVFVDFLIIGESSISSYLERKLLVDCANYDTESRLNESSLHFAGGRKSVRFADIVNGTSQTFGNDDSDAPDAGSAPAYDPDFDADTVAAFAVSDADEDDSFSDAEIDPEEFCETVVEPLGTVGQLSESETGIPLDAAPFGDLLDDADADEEPF